MRTVLLSVLLSLGLVVASCTAAPSFAPGECDPDSYFPVPECIDAGTDAGDAGTDAEAETDDAGQSACTGRCVPVPSGNAGYWTEMAISLFVAAPGALPTECPPGTSSEKFRLFADLDAPAAECAACECGASGACSGLPENMEIRAGACGEMGAASLPFDGPAGWDGSCTSENALPAGAQCGGEPCAQSVWVSPLPGPTSESCTPKSETPAFTKKTDWKLAGLACMANTNDDACYSDGGTEYCVSDPGPGWLQCIVREGVDVPCPDNYLYARYEMFPEDGVIDDRGCANCECGEPAGGGCTASIRLYDDAACASQSEQNGLQSPYDQCVNILPVGHALAAKAITDLAYVPGSCETSGGTPTGSAVRDVTRAVTFCCLHPFYLIK